MFLSANRIAHNILEEYGWDAAPALERVLALVDGQHALADDVANEIQRMTRPRKKKVVVQKRRYKKVA